MAPWFPTGLLPRVERISRKMGFPVELYDRRLRPVEGFPEFTKQPIVDRDYQLAAADAALKLGRGVLDMPPRSGKTRTMCEIHRRIALPTLWLAPTDRIVQQTRGVLEGFFGANYVTHLVGTKAAAEAANRRVVVCTAATAARLSPDFYKTREVLVVDEFHHGSAKSYRKDIFQKCDHIFFRFGMTGTFFRSGLDEMAMHALLSTVIYKVTSQELLDREFLVPTRVAFIPVLAPRLRGLPDNTFHGGHGKYGIQDHKRRNELVTWATVTLYQSGRRTLVLVGTKIHGRKLRDMIQAFVRRAPSGARFQSVEFISTDTDRSIQGDIIDSFLEGREVKVLIGTSLLGEGVDLPSADALLYAKGQQAKVSLTQNAYRVCTATPGKSEAIIVDFADRHNKHLMAHSLERLGIYYEEPTFSVSARFRPHCAPHGTEGPSSCVPHGSMYCRLTGIFLEMCHEWRAVEDIGN
jgi:superfamily II DNA or RNA helicase